MSRLPSPLQAFSRRSHEHAGTFGRELVLFAALSSVGWWCLDRHGIRHRLDEFLSGRRTDIYGDLLSLEATLLGFIVAVLTIVLGYANSPRFDVVRETRHWKGFFQAYTRAMRWSACATLGSLVALLIDQDGHTRMPVTALCLVSTALSMAFIAWMLWVTEGAVRIVIGKKARGPGE